jgi:2'-5' RNA ligase/preprotein translocase subunit YajC
MAVSAEQKQRLLSRAAAIQARGTAALANAPQPLRRALSNTAVRFRAESGPTQSIAAPQSRSANLAGVEENDPRTIDVMDQAAFDKAPEQIATHEGMHLWQNSLPPSIQAAIPKDNPSDPYRLPSTDDVSALLKRGGKITDLPREQQSVVAQYYTAQGGDHSAPQHIRDTYGKLIGTMNSIPQSVIEGTDPDAAELNTHPRAPLPPADVPGSVMPVQKLYPEKKKVDLSGGFVRKSSTKHDITKHPAGKVTAIDEESGLPIVRRHHSAERNPEPSKNDTPVKKSAPMSAAAAAKPSNEDAKAKAAGEAQPERETKYEYGNTQANVPEESDAYKAVQAMQRLIPEEHLAGKGKDVDKPHVTVRYGIQGHDTSKIKDYLSKQKPFEAKLGKTQVFPPSKNSDGAAVVNAEVHSPDLHRMNSEIAKHGDFKESDFPDYKPHVTVAYVKPEHTERYKGMKHAEGKSFKVTHVAISDRNGNHEEVPLGGKTEADSKKAAENQKKTDGGFGALSLKKGQTVHLTSGTKGTVQHVNTSMRIVRVRTHNGKNLVVRHSMIAGVEEDGKDDRNRSAELASTT